MALDGIVVANIVHELNSTLAGGRINKIAQPEKDELLLTIKGQDRDAYKLFLSAGAGMPLIYLTEGSKPSPITAPNFCMLLRKHLTNGKILEITQPGLERVVFIKIEHMDELGDLKVKYLIIELMGKHSNIIFCDDSMTIIDSIKRVSQFMSSVREVLPGRKYFIPETVKKLDPLTADYNAFKKNILSKAMPVGKAIYTGLTGISPLAANEICYRASIDSDASTSSLDEAMGLHLYRSFERIMEQVKNKDFSPNIIIGDKGPVEFSSIELTCYPGYEVKTCSTASSMLETYYAEKHALSVMQQKSADLRKLVANSIERAVKKYDLQLKQLQDTEKRDKYKLYGELITAYGYGLEEGAKELAAQNYYNNNEEIRIPLDPTMSPMDNAKMYFEKYGKLKRTYEALSSLIKETEDEIRHLESIRVSLDMAANEHDLNELKRELMEYGYIKKKPDAGRPSAKDRYGKNAVSKPLHYVSSDGYHIYVGKNNYQNEEITFKLAGGGDWWFHAKNLPGSHVIVKSEGTDMLPDRTFEEAARLAAYYSSARNADKVEVDYTKRKNIKKPNGKVPGFVIYSTNYSMVVDTDITGIRKIED
ncbi:MAG: fibronectin/fibrinogen-binding protein [Clostridiales bacterium]|jgi:predicted ribosome quality control (RQC) complex YloA/Tae2 family protein|nr:fibronectin/fibrinogen-binding protein [Clostridiales bacterium]